MISINGVVRLPDKDSGVSLSIARLNNIHIDSTKTNSKKFFRRQALHIKNKKDGQSILRYVMGHSSLSIKRNQIALDYDGVDALGLTYNEECDLAVRKANYLEIIFWYVDHADAGMALSTRLGLLGVFLGVLSLVLAL